MRHEGHLEFTVKELRFFKSVGLQREIPKFLFTRHEITTNLAVATAVSYVRLPVAASLEYQWPESLIVRFCVRKST